MVDIEFGLTQDREATAPLEPFLNPLPRSVSRDGQFALLDGEWRFALDLEDRGLRQKWHLGHAFAGTATWPGAIESQMASAGDIQAAREAAKEPATATQHAARSDAPGGAGRTRGATAGRRWPWTDEVIAWYERDFEVPPEWIASPDAVVQVTFGACGYETRVWLNGVPLPTVEGEEVHLGEWTSFSYELPPEHLRPVNRLTVRVADSLDPDTPRGKQESHVYKRGGIWYQTTSGPVRSVWIEPVERNRLRSRLGVVSTVPSGGRDGGGSGAECASLVEFRVTTRVHDPGEYRLRLVVSERGAQRAAGDQGRGAAARSRASGASTSRSSCRAPDRGRRPIPRSTSVVAQLGCPGGHVSQIEATFRAARDRGARAMGLPQRRAALPGRHPLPARHGHVRRDAPPHARDEASSAATWCGCTSPASTRASTSWPTRWGCCCGWRCPARTGSSPRSREKHWDELQRLLVHVGSHPSVVILSLYNEDWGAQDIATNPETRAYIARAHAHLRQHEPQLLVVDNDGWQHVSTEGRLQSDLLTVHLYKTEVGRLGRSCSTAWRRAKTKAWRCCRSSWATPSSTAARCR